MYRRLGGKGALLVQTLLCAKILVGCDVCYKHDRAFVFEYVHAACPSLACYQCFQSRHPLVHAQVLRQVYSDAKGIACGINYDVLAVGWRYRMDSTMANRRAWPRTHLRILVSRRRGRRWEMVQHSAHLVGEHGLVALDHKVAPHDRLPTVPSPPPISCNQS